MDPLAKREQGQDAQEAACAETFLRWFSGHLPVRYSFSRAEEFFPELTGKLRWEFVAKADGRSGWLAIEVKSLVIPEQRRQFNDWSSMCREATRQLDGRVKGTFFLLPDLTWTFSTADGKRLVHAVVEALIETSDSDAPERNLGPSIAARFDQWPTKSPSKDQKLWQEQRIWKVVSPPEDLIAVKVDEKGCVLEMGSAVPAPFDVDPALVQAITRVFDPRGRRTAKPNAQLAAAREVGAQETVLLLDSHIKHKADTVAKALAVTDPDLLSSIDGVYLVSVGMGRVERDGEEVTSPFKLKFGTEGLIVRRPNSTSGPQRRYGHHHIFVDDTVAPNPRSKIPVDDSHIHYHQIESEVLLDLEPGQHTLTLVFGNAYDYPYEFKGDGVGLLTETITVNVVGARKIFFIEPEDEAAIREFPFKVKVGSTDVDESTGHYVIVWGGGVYPFPPKGERVPEDDNHIHMAPGQMEIEMDIKAGGHEFTLLFVDENNMLSDPPLTAAIDVAAWKPVKLEAVGSLPGE